MNREHPPCGTCAKYIASHCEEFDRAAAADDQPCVLFLARGSWTHKKQQRNVTISRASAATTKTRDASHDDIATRP